VLDSLLREKEDVFSVVTIIGALIVSPALLVFVARPDLFEQLDTIHLLLLLPGIGFGFLMVCVFAGTYVRDARSDRANHIRQRDGQPIVPEMRKEWYLFAMTAAFANMFLLFLTIWAYWHRIRLGASLVALSLTLLIGSVVFHILIEVWPINWTNPPRGGRTNA
jgi:hypothetical protein